MTVPTMALWDYLGKFGLQLEDDLIREGIRAVIQAVIAAEVTQRIGAARYERNPERITQRIGPSSCAAWRTAGCRACGWSWRYQRYRATPTRG